MRLRYRMLFGMLSGMLSGFLRDVSLALAQSLEFLTILPLSRFYKRAASSRRTRVSETSLSSSPIPASSHFFWLERHGWSASICGLLIGSVCSLCAVLTFQVLPNQVLPNQVLPNFICVCLTLLCGMILSGALHEDGLADTSDALGVVMERRILVMESPDIGSFAVLALILSFAIRAAALTFLLEKSLGTLVLSLLLLHLSSRSSFALWFRFALSMRGARLASKINKPSLFSVFSSLFMCSFFSFVFLPLFSSVIFLLVFALCSVCLLLFFVRFFDGASGDLCGFGEQVLECVLGISLCAIMLH